jgi:hypothetical protein
MSLDYPFYEELRRLKHRGAKWWIVGDAFYYIGLLAAMIAIPGGLAGVFFGLMGRGWVVLFVSIAAFVIGVPVFFLGAALKRHAYRLAERDGIFAAEVYNRNEERRR